MSSRDGRLGVGIVGAGRVGPVLGAALAAAGHALVGISAGTDDERDRVEALLPGVPVLDVPQSSSAPSWSCSLCPTTSWPSS